MTIMSAHKSAEKGDFYWAYQVKPVKVLLVGGLTMSECLMTIMSSQRRVQVSFVRDEEEASSSPSCLLNTLIGREDRSLLCGMRRRRVSSCLCRLL
jgi:hypothetical protein